MATPEDSGRRSASEATPTGVDLLHFHRKRADGYLRVLELLAPDGSRLSSTGSRCNDPAHPARQAAAEETDLSGTEHRIDEVRILAALARSTATAISQGHLERALRLADLQSTLLSEHSLHCLSTWSAALGPVPGPLAEGFTRLEDLLREDRRLLVEGAENVSIR